MGPEHTMIFVRPEVVELLRSLNVQGVALPALPAPVRPVEPTEMPVTRTATEDVKVRILPDGRMTPTNAARYLGREEKTLAQWRSQGKGPKYIKMNGRIFYFKDDLDAEVAKCRT